MPLQAGDGRGLTGFYLVIGWIVGGYLVASLLGVAGGARPATTRRAAIRLACAGALRGGVRPRRRDHRRAGARRAARPPARPVGPGDAASCSPPRRPPPPSRCCSGSSVSAWRCCCSWSWATPAPAAPTSSISCPFWRAIGNALPNGAGTDTVRRIVYFESNGITVHLIVIAASGTAPAPSWPWAPHTGSTRTPLNRRQRVAAPRRRLPPTTRATQRRLTGPLARVQPGCGGDDSGRDVGLADPIDGRRLAVELDPGLGAAPVGQQGEIDLTGPRTVTAAPPRRAARLRITGSVAAPAGTVPGRVRPRGGHAP